MWISPLASGAYRNVAQTPFPHRSWRPTSGQLSGLVEGNRRIPPQKVDFKSCGINKPRDRLSGPYNHPEGVAAANGQEAGEMFQRKMFHLLQNSLVFFGCAYGQLRSAGKMGSPDEYVFNPM